MPFITVNGVGVSYGPVRARNPFARHDMPSGFVGRRKLILHFDFNDLPEGGTGRNLSSGPIPSGSVIIDAYWQTKVAFAGAGLSYDIGLEDSAGNAIDYRDGTGAQVTSTKDELWDGLGLQQINQVGEVNAASTHDGTNSGILCARQVDKAAAVGVPHLVEDGFVVVTAVAGTPTAGRAVIVVEYVPPLT